MNSSNGPSGGPAFLQNPKKRNLIAVAFVAGIIFLAIIVVSIFVSLSKKDNAPLVDVVAYQTELLRISELGLKGSKDLSTLSYVSTLRSFIQSDLTQTSGYLLSNGKELEKTDLSMKLDNEVEKDLESATLRNTFDEALVGFFEKTSAGYKQSLQNALNSASSDEEKTILETAAKNILTLEGTQEKSGVSARTEVTKL